jgi:formylglycine-generating enzyme required for sulfatase activity
MSRVCASVLVAVLASCGRTETPAAAGPSATANATATATADADANANANVNATATADAQARAVAPPDMLLVPAGTFTMGSHAGGEEDERPAHKVTLKAFFLDKTEVTNEAYAQCVAASVCKLKSEYVASRHPDFNGPKQPVSGVSWDDARGYCAWKGKRLPREAELERAVRDDDGRLFPWGNDPPTPDRAVYSKARTEEVGTHPAGRGPYGHDDLAGNVWEWMEDEYDPYAYRRATAGEGKPGTCDEIMAALNELRAAHKQGFTGSNPIPDECEHSIRGGAYNYSPEGLRSTNRVHHPGRYRIPMLGFRCAKDAT